MEQKIADHAGGVFRENVKRLKRVPFAALARALLLGHDVLAQRRGVVAAGRADHLANDMVVGRVVDRGDLVGDVHDDVIGHIVAVAQLDSAHGSVCRNQRGEQHYRKQKGTKTFPQSASHPFRRKMSELYHISAADSTYLSPEDATEV